MTQFVWRTQWAAVLIFVAGIGNVTSADQTTFGQPFTRNMVSPERGLPAEFDPASGKNIKWKAALGEETYSTPVIARGKVLIGTNNGRPRDARNKGDRAVLMCFDERDGSFLWQLAVPKVTNSVFWDWPRSGMCSTPTVEGERIYLVSNRGEVLCLDIQGQSNGNDGAYRDEAAHCVPAGESPIEPAARDGDILWLFDMIKECGVRQHDQAHGSPLLHGQYLYVNTSNGVDDSHRQIHAPDAPSLVVLEKATGRLVAMDDEHIGPRIFHSTWSSPVLGQLGGRDVIFFAGGDGIVYGFEPVNATPPPGGTLKLKKLWQFDCDPQAPKENVHKFNSNRRVSPTNIKSMPVYRDGKLFVTAGGDVWWGKTEAWLKCIATTGTGDVTSKAEVWSYPLEKHCMSTPSVAGQFVFVADCGNNVHCVDASTGKPYWSHKTKGEIWSSTLVADNKVYVGTRRNDFWVLDAGKGLKELSSIQLDSPIHGSPVAANGVLYVATMRNLYAIAK